jgi:hypothetical protein
LNQRPSGYEPDELPGCSTLQQRRATCNGPIALSTPFPRLCCIIQADIQCGYARLGEDLGFMGRWGDTLEAGDEPFLGQCNFRTDPRSRGAAAGMRHPDARALYRYITTIHVELPGHEPCARRGSESPYEVTEPIFSSNLSADPFPPISTAPSSRHFQLPGRPGRALQRWSIDV